MMSADQQPVRVMFYVQHLLGIGHLMRARRIALAMRDAHLHVCLVTGGMPLPGFDVPGIEHIELPAMAVSLADFGALVDSTGKPIDEAFKARRCAQLLDLYDRLRPDIAILEAFPFGRRQVRFELLPLIDAIETSTPRPILLASIRDILQKRVKPGRDDETVRLIQKHFDHVLVHGDPVFTDLASSFAKADDIKEKIIYTGLVSGAPPAPAMRKFSVVVSAGGGAVGGALVQAAIDASRHLPSLDTWCVITGPNLPQYEFEHLVDSAPPNVSVERFCEDFTSILATAQLSISQAGYNTVTDILQAGCRAVLVPFSSGGETEQAARAARLEQLAVATVLSEEQLSTPHLITAIQQTLANTQPVSPLSIDTNGASNTASALLKLALKPTS